MRRFVDGDELSFALLFERYKDRLYRYLKRMCRDDDASTEELFQDIWEKVVKNRARFDIRKRFAPYLFAIAHNRLIDHFRCSSTAVYEQYQDEINPSNEGSVEDQVLSNEQIKRFKQVLNNLTAPQREVFVLHEETNMTMFEIAETIGVKTETAKSRLRFALINLREGMKGYT